MRFGDERFVGGQVPRVASLTAEEFLRDFRGRSPVVVAGGGAHTRACKLWDPEYLAARCGSAPLDLLVHVYEEGAIERDYAGETVRRVDLATYVRDLAAGRAGSGYLFNTEQAVFRADAAEPELRVGRAARANPFLAPLAEDFELPGFVLERDLIHGALFMGCSRDKSPLHYDYGGEAKTMTQVRGRKRVLLFAPDQVRRLYLRGLFEPERFNHDSTYVSRVNLCAPDLERFPELAEARALEAVLEPGDVLYWPPFWFHDFRNLDDPTFAAVCVLEEVRPSSMLVRELLGFTSALLLQRFRERGEHPSPEVVRAFQELEEVVLSPEMVAKRSLWAWCDAASRSLP